LEVTYSDKAVISSHDSDGLAFFYTFIGMMDGT
jgi:hypothetical protein